MLIHLQRTCTLYEMLDDYVRLDLIDERVCRKCSLLATVDRLQAAVDAPLAPDAGKRAITTAKRRRRDLATLRAHLDAGDFEDDDLADLALDRAERPATKQSMFARPPRVLAVHLVRSTAYRSGGAVKNPCRVAVPAVLDLGPYTTSPALPVRPQSSMGAAPPSMTSRAPRHRYRLTSVVEHFGTHSYGHYIAYAQRRDRWFRISDETVDHADEGDALAANPFLLFYERIDDAVEGSPAAEVAVVVAPRVVQRLVGEAARGRARCTKNVQAR
jgi:ubiquitin carboxyl-terminal hydrolase 1